MESLLLTSLKKGNSSTIKGFSSKCSYKNCPHQIIQRPHFFKKYFSFFRKCKNPQTPCLENSVNQHHLILERLFSLGFVKGAKITVVDYTPLRDPLVINLNGSFISLRLSEADLIIMEDLD